MSTLRKAIEIALDAHDGQTDRGGAPYIFHPLRIMLSLGSEDEQIVAALHDVVEDSPKWTIGRLADEGFSPLVLEAVAALTKADEEEYFRYVGRIASVPLAISVKLADLADNLNPERLGREPTQSDEARFKKYRKAQRILVEK